MTKVTLNDPVLDAKDEYTKLFLLAEYWKDKYCKNYARLAKLECENEIMRNALIHINCESINAEGISQTALEKINIFEPRHFVP